MKSNSDELTWKNVGAYLKNLRYEEKKSQVDFAAEWGISERTLRMLEEGAGHVSSDTLLAMARKKGDIVFVILMKALHQESIEEVLGVQCDAEGKLVSNPTYDKLVGQYDLHLENKYKGENMHFRSSKSKSKSKRKRIISVE